MPEELATVSTEDLVQEMLVRCEHGAVVFRREGEYGPGTNGVMLRCKGDTHVISGLIGQLNAMLMAELAKNTKAINE